MALNILDKKKKGSHIGNSTGKVNIYPLSASSVTNYKPNYVCGDILFSRCLSVCQSNCPF